LLITILPLPFVSCAAVCASGWYGYTNSVTRQATCNQCPGTRPVSKDGSRTAAECRACPTGAQPNEIFDDCGELCSRLRGWLVCYGSTTVQTCSSCVQTHTQLPQHCRICCSSSKQWTSPLHTSQDILLASLTTSRSKHDSSSPAMLATWQNTLRAAAGKHAIQLYSQSSSHCALCHCLFRCL
jgi:hypothetical protein